MKTTCLIVDDEKSARAGMNLLCEQISHIEVVGVCKNGMEAVDQIQTLRPMLVLLDIQMPGLNGFEVIQNLASPLPQIIFITAHDQFAIRAFEVNAIDYLLKPFSDQRFFQAIEKAHQRIHSDQKQSLEGILPDAGLPHQTNVGHLLVKENGNMHKVMYDSIRFIEAYDYYVKIYTADRMLLIRDSMKHIETQLQDPCFLRAHKSYLVNKTYVRSLVKSESGKYKLIMDDDTHLNVSRGKLRQVKEWLG